MSNRFVVSHHRESTKVPVGIPPYLTDYKVFALPFFEEYPTDQKESQLLSVSGFYEGNKVVIIDSNFDGDLSDERIFRMEYDQKEYFGLAKSGRIPDMYKIEPADYLDNIDRNELTITKKSLN